MKYEDISTKLKESDKDKSKILGEFNLLNIKYRKMEDNLKAKTEENEKLKVRVNELMKNSLI